MSKLHLGSAEEAMKLIIEISENFYLVDELINALSECSESLIKEPALLEGLNVVHIIFQCPLIMDSRAEHPKTLFNIMRNLIHFALYNGPSFKYTFKSFYKQNAFKHTFKILEVIHKELSVYVCISGLRSSP